jgi:methionyl-tRNA formyltransferase
MRVTVFTSNQPRHLHLIELLSSIADVTAVQECTTIAPGKVADFYAKSPVMQEYFERVLSAEREVFGAVRPLVGAFRQLAVRMGDLNLLSLDSFGEALSSDYFVVFGASYIKGPLCELLVERGAVNIHMGVSPYYRGHSTNFWALYDGRADLVGATIHRLTKGLDSGPILFHALPEAELIDPFLLGMRAVKVAHDSLVRELASGSLMEMEPVAQDRSLELRYSKGVDFTDEVASEYLGRLPSDEEVLAQLGRSRATAFVSPRYG